MDWVRLIRCCSLLTACCGWRRGAWQFEQGKTNPATVPQSRWRARCLKGASRFWPRNFNRLLRMAFWRIAVVLVLRLSKPPPCRPYLSSCPRPHPPPSRKTAAPSTTPIYSPSAFRTDISLPSSLCSPTTDASLSATSVKVGRQRGCGS